ncbi:DUF1080 domain-containing protein [Stieleria sp. TO1_6]|uniref:DUF1080 domain-containing protein n=1 Tax=Stieleria tagensis TaxID=2956795 RepID=UPI00209BAD92|nr:DUF1080 domain-containing protein [Stieleria tagensis]MCO8124859.1 DUF1080 domain-containing protein [Stieleria tagensis]
MNRLTRNVATNLLMIGCWIAIVPTSPLSAEPPQPTAATETPQTSNDDATTPWITLADHWTACQFGGDGEIQIKDGVITMEYGDPLTGVKWDGPFVGDPAAKADLSKDKKPTPKALPRDNYELRWECRRDQGFDFMCAFTFPVGKDHVSLVMGGWGGGVTGISSVDGRDASDNETTMFKAFENDTWYKARVRVDSKNITAWIDDTELFAQPRQDHTFDIRFEMDPCTPLGIANFESTSKIRNIQIRPLVADKVAPADQESKKSDDK